MSAARIHLIAPAGSCGAYLRQLNCDNVPQLCALVREWTGSTCGVTANEALIFGEEDESDGGRNDDAHRADDITAALRDDDCLAIVALRGGAWFTRILPHINFSVLDDRTQPVTVFGFSELTTLVNLVAAHPMGRGVHDMGCAFLAYGLKQEARRTLPPGADLEERVTAYWQAQLIPQTRAWFADIRSILEGHGTERPLHGELLRGRLSKGQKICLIGGNLTVLSTIVGTAYEPRLFANPPAPLWLFLEDYNDKIERFDRFLAHLTLARWWDRVEGLLLGNFHLGDTDLTHNVLSLLRFHLPESRGFPILVAPSLGHVWPMAPLPLRTPITVRRNPTSDGVKLHWTLKP